MSDPLATYIEDHLAGATYAIDLLEAIRDQYAGDPLQPLKNSPSESGQNLAG
jgi:hypothetical protein